MTPNQNKHPQQSNRITSLDILRGVAVLIMVAAHGIYFFHDNSNSFFRLISRTGNFFAFTTFLFVSGAASYMAHLSDDKKGRSGAGHILRRTLVILSGYYVVAFASVLEDLAAQGTGAVTYILDILTFARVPSFSEFLLPFVVFHVSLLFLGPVYRYLSRRMLAAGVVSLLIFLVGSALYSAPVPGIIEPYLAVFAGREGFLRFPLLQYFPVFVFGIYWGRNLSLEKSGSGKLGRSLLLGGLFWGISALTFFVPGFRNIQFFNPLNRWPPSIGFISEGLAFIFLFESVFPLLVTIVRSSRLWGFLRFIGMDSFDIYIVNTLILFLYRFARGGSFANPVIVISLTVGLLAVTVFLSAANVSFRPSPGTAGLLTLGLHRRYRLKKRYLATVAALFIFLIIQIHAGNTDVTTGGVIRQRNLPQSELSLLEFADEKAWFNEEYGYMKRLIVRNTGTTGIPKGAGMSVTFDHRSLVTAGKSKKDARDLMLVYRTDPGFEMLSLRVERPNLPNTTIVFPAHRDILPGRSDASYELYYGSDFPLAPLSEPPDATSGITFAGSFEDEQGKGLYVKKNRTWFIPGYSGISQELVITVNSDEPEDLKFPNLLPENGGTDRYRYTIPALSKSGPVPRLDDGTFSVSIPLEGIPYGIYAVRVSDTRTGRISPSAGFYVTAPVYVSLTLDWEGYDVSDTVLSRIGILSETHKKVPITHFFNPRIYIADEIPKERRDRITRFIKDRLGSHGDELAMHLHMHEDIVRASGVTPKTEPRWGYLDDGYDIPTTAYSEGELLAIFGYAKSLFQANGLPAPAGYRSGGWFSDPNVFKALEKSGFSYDSSGRDGEPWGGKIKSPWHLSPTSQPYFPSRTDINKSGNPQFTLFEIPNNGGNTFEYDSPVLMNRLKENVPEGFTRTRKSVVFLSHPQFADREFARLTRLLNTVDDMLYENDAGPVVYTTTGNIYSLWND